MTASSKTPAPAAPETKPKEAPVVDGGESEGLSSKIPLFVYGSLRRGYPLHGWLEDQTFVGIGDADGLAMIDLGEYPAVVNVGGKDHSVTGEYFLVDSARFAQLQAMERRVGYSTVSVKGVFTEPDKPLTGQVFKAHCFVFHVSKGCSEWVPAGKDNGRHVYAVETNN